MKEDELISFCKKKIEERLGWPDGSEWKHADFVELSARIEKATKTRLSASTLMRVWGKIDYQGRQQKKTLDALAEFAGYKDWFRLSQIANKIEDETLENEEKKSFFYFLTIPIKVKFYHALLAGIVFLGLFIYFSVDMVYYLSEKPILVKEKAPVEPVPKISVVSADTALKFGQKAKIVLDVEEKTAEKLSLLWGYYEKDKNYQKRIDLKPGRNKYEHTFNYPGAYVNTITNGKQTIKSLKTVLYTDNFLHGFSYKNDKNNIYFPEPAYDSSGGAMYLPYEKAKPHIETDSGRLWYQNLIIVKDFNLPVDWFKTTFVLRNSVDSEYAYNNQDLFIHFIGETGYVEAYFFQKGYKSFSANLFFSEKRVSGGLDDLSMLAVDMNRWNMFRIINVNKTVRIFLGEEKLYEAKYDKSIGRLKGIRIRSKGLCKAKKIEVMDPKDKKIFLREF